MTEITLRVESPRQADVVRLVEALDVYQSGLYPPESNHLLDLEGLAGPSIRFFVARGDGRALGCGALRIDPAGWGELKRMFVSPEARGLNLGRRLLERIEEEARRGAQLHAPRDRHPPAGGARALPVGGLRGAGCLRRVQAGLAQRLHGEESLTAPPHAAQHRGSAAHAEGTQHHAAAERFPAPPAHADHHVGRDGVDVGTDSPSGEGERICGVPEAAPVVRDTEMKLAALRVGAPLGSPAESTATHPRTL